MTNNRFLVLFGVLNCFFGVILLGLHFVYFILIVFGWVADRPFYGFFDWLNLVVFSRVIVVTIFISSFLLLLSGIALLRRKFFGVKLSKSALLIIAVCFLLMILSNWVSSLLYHQIKFTWITLEFSEILIILIYTIFEIQYLKVIAIDLKP